MTKNPNEWVKMTLSALVEKELVEDIRVERLHNIHRAVAIATDRKGTNFAVLQSQPNAWYVFQQHVYFNSEYVWFINFYGYVNYSALNASNRGH